MNILPTPPGSPRGGASRVKDSASATPARPHPSAEGAAESGRDRAEISSEAMGLHDGLSTGASELSATRLRAVLERMSSGHYDREDVRAQALRSIARDLGIV